MLICQRRQYCRPRPGYRPAKNPLTIGGESLFGRFNSLFGRLGNWLRKDLIYAGFAGSDPGYLGLIAMFCQ